jgi:hypothetical protein
MSDNGVDTINPKIQRKRKPWVYLSDYEKVIKLNRKLTRFSVLVGFVAILELIFLINKVFS